MTKPDTISYMPYGIPGDLIPQCEYGAGTYRVPLTAERVRVTQEVEGADLPVSSWIDNRMVPLAEFVAQLQDGAAAIADDGDEVFLKFSASGYDGDYEAEYCYVLRALEDDEQYERRQKLIAYLQTKAAMAAQMRAEEKEARDRAEYARLREKFG